MKRSLFPPLALVVVLGCSQTDDAGGGDDDSTPEAPSFELLGTWEYTGGVMSCS